MTSNDLIILEAINGLESEMNQKFEIVNKRIDNLETEIKDTRNELLTEIRLNQHDIAHLQTSVYWGFAIMGIVIALVSFVVAVIALFPYLRKEKPEVKPERSEELSPSNIRDIRALIHEETGIVNSAAVVGK